MLPERGMPMTIVSKVSDLIGNTPLFELARTDTGTRLLLKLEQFNPTGAAKIRMAREMVLAAERRGTLMPGGNIVESTSGNTGQGLAVLAVERGYRFTAVVDNHACADKLRAMTAMGAELIYVGAGDDAALHTSAREETAAQLALMRGGYFTEQHNNDDNPVGYHAVADELLRDLAGAPVDVLISAVGTGGSLFGTAERLRQLGNNARVIGVEPEGSIAFGGEGGPYRQSGTGTPPGAEVGTAVNYALLDEGVKVGDAEAFATARAVAAHTALLIGGSAGGSVYAALRRLAEFPPGSTVVTIVCDGGEKYLDTVFDDSWMTACDLLNPVLESEVSSLLYRYRPVQVAARDYSTAR